MDDVGLEVRIVRFFREELSKIRALSPVAQMRVANERVAVFRPVVADVPGQARPCKKISPLCHI